MAKPAKRRIEGGRVTPKGTGAKGTPAASPQPGRYTPPTARAARAPSPPWVPVVMFGLLGLGVAVIVVNYIGIILPGATSNGYLMLGLALILGGIIASTQYR